MICPKCKQSETKVIDSRDIGSCIRRRRKCIDCDFRFTTYEKIEAVKLYITKKDDNLELYDRKKIYKGIFIACKNRPVKEEQIKNIVDKIECRLIEKNKENIESRVIGKMVLEELKQLDKVCYLRFASVHKKFANPERFTKELKKIN